MCKRGLPGDGQLAALMFMATFGCLGDMVVDGNPVRGDGGTAISGELSR